MASNKQRKIASIRPVASCISSGFGMYEFGIARNRGRVPNWVDTAVSLIFIIGVPTGILLQARHSEEVHVGSLSSEKIVLEPGEDVFSKTALCLGSSSLRGSHSTQSQLRRMAQRRPSQSNRTVEGSTDEQRLVFGLLVGRTWRVLELYAIREARWINGRWPYKDALLIEYEFDNRIEGMSVLDRLRPWKGLKVALERAVTRI